MELAGGATQVLFELAVMIIIATVFAYIARLIKQPLIPAYIIAGIVIGPLALGLVSDTDFIQVMSHIGIMFLLFIVGLEMNLHKLKKVGAFALLAGVLQVALTFAVGYGIASAFGISQINAIFLGMLAAFSSTMIVIKILSERDELDTLHGRLLVGILIVQDIIVILAMPFLSSAASFSWLIVAKMILGTVILSAIAALFDKFMLEKLFSFAARSDELLFLLSLSVGFVFALGAQLFGFSIAIGAFIAGVMLANLPYHYNIIGKISPLKDFFITIFFVSLGLQVASFSLKSVIWPFIALLAVILFVKPLIIMLILSIFGYGRRTSFLTGTLLGQVSEFSLILIPAVAMLSNSVISLSMALAIITITLTTYVFNYEDKIYTVLSPFLAVFEKLSLKKQPIETKELNVSSPIILVGCDRMGSIILKTLEKDHKKQICVIDSNPEIIARLNRQKINCMYGDIVNTELLDRIAFEGSPVVISTIPQFEDNISLLRYANKKNSSTTLIVVANNPTDANDLYSAGADYVIVPKILSGESLSLMLKRHFHNKHYFSELKAKQTGFMSQFRKSGHA
ncbi:MAG: cation:proton antiporter [Candidatus Nanoarchaeia archaeon]|nr:cation:proton antiporter [Candidatus Nanoarchaeia archaeon]